MKTRNIQKELEIESLALKDKLFKLKSFIDGYVFSSISKTQQDLLKQQYVAMKQYNKILELRIEDIKENK